MDTYCIQADKKSEISVKTVTIVKGLLMTMNWVKIAEKM